MTYADQCKGSITVDKKNTATSGKAEAFMYTNSAFAQLILSPTSRCLHSVTVEFTTKSAFSGAVMEIVPETGSGIPSLDPHQAPIQYTGIISGENIINHLLPDLSSFWIVLSPQDYNPGGSLTAELGVSMYGLGAIFTDYVAVKSGSSAWTPRSGKTYEMLYQTKIQTLCPAITCTFTL